ncbi:MAG: serine/threonine protein kinase [Acidobacteria bacterium]|nr:serine/threonine protein kinase [Acidobacteriota bacterium]
MDRLPAQRVAFLEEACRGDAELRREVKSLLVSDVEASGFLEKPAAALTSLAPGASGEPLTGRRISAYQILREIGHGGMGAVYLAMRADDAFRKQVAIKLIHPSMATDAIQHRFRRERQILAQLDHPHIAKLLDGGTTEDGLPYLVMDYVEGLPIDVHCDTYCLPVVERLRLFRTACAAVHNAHQRQIIHRDLKPSNILVTAAHVPKLLDFGIAKVLAPELSTQFLSATNQGQRPMTPGYASPEQVLGEPITPVSDVYSLGVLLYVLLTGHHPYRVQSYTPQAMERAVREEEPQKPSLVISQVVNVSGGDDATRIARTPESVSRTRGARPDALRRQLAGDLDNIVLMALRKEPGRRYASAEQFSEDIGRHLEGRPVLARPDTVAYRTSKFIRRNRARVIEGIVLAVVALALLAGGMYWQARRLRILNSPMQSLEAVYLAKGYAGNPALIQSRFGKQGDFELVVPLATGGLAHYRCDNDNPARPWSKPTIFGGTLGPVDAVALIQSNVSGTKGGPGNFEVIARVGSRLVHFMRADRAPFPWWGSSRPVVSAEACGSPALIQSRFGPAGDFELVFPLCSGGIAHYRRDNGVTGGWIGPVVFATKWGRVDGVTLIQSNFSYTKGPGHLELVARIGDQLWLAFRLDSEPFAWRVWDIPFASGVAGTPALIQGRFGVHGDFELVVPWAAGGLAHFTRENDSGSLLWTAPVIFGQSLGHVDAVTFIHSTLSQTGGPGHLEVIARVGKRLVGFWRDDAPPFAWHEGHPPAFLQGGTEKGR